uniref:Glutamate receptor n=1 Tax=Caenorhabditis japonica TaxID=281687 RepID=A0A8R1E3G7_CAEJA
MRQLPILWLFLVGTLSLELGGGRKVAKPPVPPTREEVNIAVVYQHYAGRSKSYDKAFKEVIRKINDATAVSSLRRLANRYIFSAVDCILPTGTFYVKEVLDCLCHNVTANNVALIIFVTASETYDSTTAAEQYFLTAASYTGIPIIAWNADNAGFTFENDLSPYRIIQMAPPIEHQARAMLALLRRYNWPKFGIVTSEMAGNYGFVTAVREELERFSNKSTNHMKASFVKGNPFHVDDGHDSFFYTFEKTGRLRNSILQISNLRTNSKGEKSWEKVGIFTNNELQMADVQWPGERANPPQGAADKFHVKVVTLHEPPFITVSDVDPDTQKCPGNQGSICDWGDVEYTDDVGVKKNRTLWKCCSGYCVDLLNKLATDIGFTYTLYKVRDEKWGLKTENGWNGLIADLMHNKADMCVTSLKLNSERARDIDFSLPFLDTGISIIVKIRSGVLSPTAFLEPFEYSTWVIILFVCIHVAAISIFVFEWVSPYSFNMQKYPPPDVPKSTVSRLMALVWAAFGLTFLAVYTANLAAFMITRVQYYDLSGIHDPMLNFPQDQKPPFRFGTVDGGNTHETMKRNWHKMHEYVKGNKFFRMNISAGVEAVKNEELDAFIYDAVVLDYWAGKDANCALMTVGKWASMTGYGIGFPKNSPYTALVNHYMLQYQQKGDLERLQNFWLTGACTPDSHSQTQSAPLGIENFLSAFVLLAGGIIVSVIVLGFEHIYCMHLREPLQKVDPNGWCGIISMAMGKSLTFTEAVDRVQEWRSRTQSLASTNSPQLKRRRSANLRPIQNEELPESKEKRRSPRFLQVETNL